MILAPDKNFSKKISLLQSTKEVGIFPFIIQF